MRAIDADKLLKKKIELYIPPEDPEETWCFGAEIVVIPIDDVKEAPTITYKDLVPHGQWVKTGNKIICTNCGEEPVYANLEGFILTKCCPNCGAKMDGGNESE